MNDLQKRKANRLKDFDYSSCDTYFITICTKNKQKLFGDIVGAPIGRPYCKLTECGVVVDNAINNIEKIYNSIRVDKYIIMPDHIHLLITIYADELGRPMAAPTIPSVINQLKGYVSKQVGFSVWQKLYFDHIIRNQKDYDEIWQYIDENPKMWIIKHQNNKQKPEN